MATRQLEPSMRGPRWWDFMQVVHQAGYALLCLLRCPMPKSPNGQRLPIDLMYIIYEIHLRMEALSHVRRRLCKGVLASLFFVCTFTAFFFTFTSGGDRWVLNPLISDFEYPLIPEHALKVFIFCKYSFAICMVYNLMKYAVERKEEMVTLMNKLEREAAMLMPGQSTESRLDACVPRITDDCNTREARQLVAMRRLFHRGVFTFDVVPEPEPVEEPEPSEDELQAVREAMELEAVKSLNDPKMLREYIRRRESRQGRRRVHLYKMKERRNKTTRNKGLRVESPLNVIEEEETSLTQFSPELLRDFRRLSGSAQKRLLQKMQHGKVETRSEVKWGITGISSLKADGDNLDIDIRDLFPNVGRPPPPPPSVCLGGMPGALSVVGAGAGAGGGSRVPLQVAKWPVSGTCRPTRSRPPSPSATQTLLTRASRSSSAATDGNAAPRTHTPTARARMASGGSVSEPSSVPSPLPSARERTSRPPRGYGHSPSPPVTPPSTPPAHQVRPKTTHRSPSPASSITASRASSPPTTPPTSPRERRRPMPTHRAKSPVGAAKEDDVTVGSRSNDVGMQDIEMNDSRKRINATATHIIVPQIGARPPSPAQSTTTRKPSAPERPSKARASPPPTHRATPPAPPAPLAPPSPRPPRTPTPHARSKSSARPPSMGRRRTPTPVGGKKTPLALAPAAGPMGGGGGGGGSSTASSATASVTSGGPSHAGGRARGSAGGGGGTRSPSGVRSAVGAAAGSGTPSSVASASSAGTAPAAICAECSSKSSNQSSGLQGSVSGTTGNIVCRDPTESAYCAWRETIATKRMRRPVSPKGTPLAVNPKFQPREIPPPQARISAKSRERRPVVVRTGREPAIKSAEGTRVWRQDRRSERRSERRTDQQQRSEKKPEQRSPDTRPDNRSEPSCKDLKKSEASLVKEIFDLSNPTTESEATSEISKVEDVNEAGGDTQNDIQVILQKTTSIVSQKGKEKKEVEISNLLEPRADWSDSASSLSGVSPSLTSTVRAFSDLVAANISQTSSEEINEEIPGRSV